MSDFPIYKDAKRNLYWRRKFLRDANFVPGVKGALKAECAKNPLFYVNYGSVSRQVTPSLTLSSEDT